MVEKSKEYVAAARSSASARPASAAPHPSQRDGAGPGDRDHRLALAIITRGHALLPGVGVPPTTPSLGTLIRIGNDFLFSGEWWITFFPAGALVILVRSVNLLGDWLRDAFNPKLR
jgi:peptide/nickel transport system permease protein